MDASKNCVAKTKEGRWIVKECSVKLPFLCQAPEGNKISKPSLCFCNKYLFLLPPKSHALFDFGDNDHPKDSNSSRASKKPAGYKSTIHIPHR